MSALPFPLTPARIAALLGVPAANVDEHWPKIELCLNSLGATSDAACIAALATIRVECPPFKPLKEYGGVTYLNRLYDTRTDLGNTPDADGDGARYCGRGMSQLTGKGNYRAAGEALGIDLVNDPERALDADVSAAVFAWFFVKHGVAAAAERGDWVRVRKIWNGGTNGLEDFLRYVRILSEACNEQNCDGAVAGAL